MSGALGRERSWLVVEDGVTLEVHAPEVLRNGEFFEMRIAVGTVDRAVDALVIGVTQDLWTDMTVNTMIPAASEESSRGGEMRFTFGHLDPGAAFLFKVDLQANPDIVLGNSGRITVYDGDRTLVSTELGMAVLP